MSIKDSGSEKKQLPVGAAVWLKKEIQSWTQKGIISTEQRKKIRSLYHWPTQKSGTKNIPAKKRSVNPVHFLGVLGAVLVGVGILSLIGFNWAGFGKGVKVGLLLLLLLIVESTGFFLFEKGEKYRTPGEGLLLLGAICFGGVIWQIGQIYHIHASFPLGVVIWAAGAVPLILLTGSKKIVVFAHSLLFLWVILVAVDFRDFSLLSSAVLFGSIAVAAYMLRSPVQLFSLFGGLLLFMFVVCSNWILSGYGVFALFSIPVLGLLFFGLGCFHRRTEGIYSVFGSIAKKSGETLIYGLILLYPFIGLFNRWEVVPVSTLSLFYFGLNALFLLGGVIFLILSRHSIMQEIKRVRLLLLSFVINGFVFLLPVSGQSILVSYLPVIALIAGYCLIFKETSLLVFFPPYLLLTFLLAASAVGNTLWTLFGLALVGVVFEYWCFFPDTWRSDGRRRELYSSVGMLLVFISAVAFSGSGLIYFKYALEYLGKAGVESTVFFGIILIMASGLVLRSYFKNSSQSDNQYGKVNLLDRYGLFALALLPLLLLAGKSMVFIVQISVLALGLIYLYRLLYHAYFRKQRIKLLVGFLSLLFLIFLKSQLSPLSSVLLLLILCNSFYFVGKIVGYIKERFISPAGFRNTGLVSTLGFMFVFTFSGVRLGLSLTIPSVLGRTEFCPHVLMFLLSSLIAWIPILLLWKKMGSWKYPETDSGLLPEERFLDSLFFLSPMVILVMDLLRVGSVLTVVVLNALYLLGVILTIFVGYRRDDRFYRYSGFAFLLMMLVVRYFEVSFSQSVKGLIFIVIGAAVIIASIFLEKNKSRLMVTSNEK